MLLNILIPILELIAVYTLNVDNYLGVYEKINMVGYVLMYMTIFMVLVRKDGRGLHDFVAMSKVEYDENLPTFNIKEKLSINKNEEEKVVKKIKPKKITTKKTTTKKKVQK